MGQAELLLPEFDREMASTRKVLECVPEDKLDWKAHPSMNSIGWNANHIVEMPGWVESILTQTELDIAPANGEPYKSPNLRTRQELIDAFDQNIASARKALEGTTDEKLAINWSLLHAGKPLIAQPRLNFIRSFVMNHIIHHRAILCTYLRLNDIEVPPMYGG